MTKPKHLIEAAAVKLLFTVFRLLPLDIASAVGGFMARSIGPLLKPHQTAAKNIARAFPGISEQDCQRILTGMWDNLGRVGAEYPHLPGKTLISRLTVKEDGNIPAPGQQIILMSAHYGNWELCYPLLQKAGTNMTIIYRAANNTLVDNIIARLRASQSFGMLPKGNQGAIKLARVLKDGQSLAMLIDQKMNEGIPVPFFGREAMTAPAIAKLAMRFDIPIIPARVLRTKGANFEWKLFPALTYEKTGDEEKDTLAIMAKINALLESWIREHPEQWFWVHQRWPKD